MNAFNKGIPFNFYLLVKCFVGRDSEQLNSIQSPTKSSIYMNLVFSPLFLQIMQI